MGHPTMQENDTAKLTPTYFRNILKEKIAQVFLPERFFIIY